MELEELGKWIIFAIVITVLILGIVLFEDKGGAVLSGIKNIMRLGR